MLGGRNWSQSEVLEAQLKSVFSFRVSLFPFWLLGGPSSSVGYSEGS